jgi:hypothetical protein
MLLDILVEDQKDIKFGDKKIVSTIWAQFFSSIVVNTTDWKKREDVRLHYNVMKKIVSQLPPVETWDKVDFSSHF